MKRIYVIIAALCALCLAASCGNTENKSAGTTDVIHITHQKGKVDVPKNPKRIICLDYSVLETLDHLNIPVIGIPKGNLPLHLEKYGKDAAIEDLGTLLEVNFEKINELRPDVIFISNRLETSYDELNKIAPTVYIKVDHTDFMKSLKEEWGIIGEIFGQQDEINEAIREIETKALAVHEKATAKNQKALVTLYNKGKFAAYGPNSRFGIIHGLFGVPTAVENIQEARHGQAISNEFIQKANPDILFVIDRSAVVDKKSSDKAAIENALVQQTNAYKNGKVIYLNPEIWYLAGSGITSVNAMIDDISQALD